jgi:hypothetical protein
MYLEWEAVSHANSLVMPQVDTYQAPRTRLEYSAYREFDEFVEPSHANNLNKTNPHLVTNGSMLHSRSL